MNVYRLKYKTNRYEGLNAFKRLFNGLIKSENYNLNLNFNSSNSDEFLKLLKGKYFLPIRGFSFQVNNEIFKKFLPNLETGLESLYCYSNTIKRESDSIGYSFNLNPTLEQYNFEIKLPYWHSKQVNIDKATDILSYLKSKRVVNIDEIKADELAQNLVSNSWNNITSKKWIYKNGNHEFSTWANVNPKINGILQGNRASGIAIKFEDEMNNEPVFDISTPILLIEEMSKYLGDNHGVKGHIRTSRLRESFNNFKLDSDSEIIIPTSKKLKFENIQEIEQIDKCEPTSSINWQLNNFNWIVTLDNSNKNQIDFYSNNLKDYDFEIQISEKIDENKLKLIEESLGMKLQFAFKEYD